MQLFQAAREAGIDVRRTNLFAGRILGLGFLVLCLWCNSGCSRDEPKTGANTEESAGIAHDSAQQAATPPPAPARPFTTPWQSESEYVVTRIVTELTTFVYYSRHYKEENFQFGAPSVAVHKSKSAPDGTPTFQIQITVASQKPVDCTLSLEKGLFSCTTYRSLIGLLAQAYGADLKAEDTAPDSDPENILLSNTAENLGRLDKTLSAQLASNFNNPQLHEKAALLIEAFSWRDNSDRFFNLLPELCRITAHRVFAEALRQGGSGGPRDNLNQALSAELIGLQSDALKSAETLPPDSPYASWKRAIRIRATGDFRILGEADSPTLLERLEWYRAFADGVSGDAAQRRYEIPKEWIGMPDWWRSLNTAKPSVESGHVLSRRALRAEVAEAYTALTEYNAAAPANISVVVSALNAADLGTIQFGPQQKVKIEILGWSLWAQLLQRHICYAISADFNFMQHLWGVPDKARAFRSKVDETFSPLVLYPFVERLNATAESYYRQAQDGEIALAQSAPERIPAAVWNEVNYPLGFCPIYIPAPGLLINAWHCENPLPGTVYDIEPRLRYPSLINRSDVLPLLKRLESLAPYSTILIHYQLSPHGKKPTPEEAIAAYDSLLEYKPYLCRYIADLFGDRQDVARQEEWLRRSVTVDPRGYEELAHLYRDQKRDAEAAEAFSQWIANDGDAVGIANDSAWLIEYFEHHGRSKEATALADRAAEVYSLRGLLAKAHLLEERKRYEEALVCYQQASDRYETPGVVIGFLLRHQTAPHPFEPELLAHLIETYFSGEQPKRLSGTSTAPSDGVLVSLQNAKIDKAGLKRGDVIVGVRGYAVSNWAHFKMIRDFDSEKPYAISVWRGNACIQLPEIPGDYRMGVDLPTYRTPNSPSLPKGS